MEKKAIEIRLEKCSMNELVSSQCKSKTEGSVGQAIAERKITDIFCFIYDNECADYLHDSYSSPNYLFLPVLCN